MEHLNRQWIIPKLRQWTLGPTVDLGFAVCDWLVSDLYVHLSLVSNACYHWWICLLVWWLYTFYFFSNFLFKFLNFFILKTFSSFFLLFLPFILTCVADRILVLQAGVRSEPLRLERWVQVIRPPETSQTHIISISESSPRDLRLNAKTQLHSWPASYSARHPMPNN